MYMLPILNIDTSIHCASHGVIILWNDTLVSTERNLLFSQNSIWLSCDRYLPKSGQLERWIL